jgi:hypothetical protein
MIIYLRPNFEVSGFHPDMMRTARLKLFTWTVDDVNYRVDLTKASTISSPYRNSYAISIPLDWDPTTWKIP